MEGRRRFNEIHYYDLPLPNVILESLGNETISLKITLSYFVDPNPGLSANISPYRYQSYGLRFDLRRKRETIREFKARVNAIEERRGPGQPDDNRWLFGPNSISAGSLHCDTWEGPAIELLGRNLLAIKPIGGWWKDRANPAVVNKAARYALVVTLKSQNTEVDLYTPISTIVSTPVDIENLLDL